MQGLCNKLNFANTAATQLDVETLLGPLALPIDLLLGHAYVSQCTGDTDVRPKNSTDHALGKARVKWLGPGCRPRANQRLQLPFLGRLFVIAHRFIQRAGQAAFAAIRTQAHVDAIGCAFARRLADDAQE